MEGLGGGVARGVAREEAEMERLEEEEELAEVGRGDRADDGSTLSIGWFVPRWGKGSTSSRTMPSSVVTPTSALDRDVSVDDPTGCGSNTVLLESLESRLYECLL